MEQQDIEHLADQLRLAYYKGLKVEPWSSIPKSAQRRWIYVVDEAYRWLVG